MWEHIGAFLSVRPTVTLTIRNANIAGDKYEADGYAINGNESSALVYYGLWIQGECVYFPNAPFSQVSKK